LLATSPVIDVEKAYAVAKEAVEGSVPESELKPLEPTQMEFGANAVAVTVSSSDGSTSFVLDAKSDNPAVFDAPAVLASLLEQFGSDLDVSSNPLNEEETTAPTLETASHFRAAVVVAGESVGELRISMGLDGEAEGGSETKEQPVADTDPQATPTDAQATPVALDPDIPDVSALASRLPNLASVNMDVTVELGRVRLPIKELLGLGSGSVVRLGTPIGESFDILVNGKAAARGDLVVVGGKLAVRIRELLGVDT